MKNLLTTKQIRLKYDPDTVLKEINLSYEKNIEKLRVFEGFGIQALNLRQKPFDSYLGPTWGRLGPFCLSKGLPDVLKIDAKIDQKFDAFWDRFWVPTWVHVGTQDGTKIKLSWRSYPPLWL